MRRYEANGGVERPGQNVHLTPAIAPIHRPTIAEVCLARIHFKPTSDAVQAKSRPIPETRAFSASIKTLARPLGDRHATGSKTKLIKICPIDIQEIDAWGQQVAARLKHVGFRCPGHPCLISRTSPDLTRRWARCLIRTKENCFHSDKPERPIFIGKQVNVLIDPPSIIYGACAKTISAKPPACPREQSVSSPAKRSSLSLR